MIKGAIFDADGTLFDSMPIWKGIKFKFFDAIGLELSDEDKKAFEGLFLREALILAKERFSIAQSHEELFELLIFFRMILDKDPHDFSLFHSEMELGITFCKVQKMKELFFPDLIIGLIRIPPDEV